MHPTIHGYSIYPVPIYGDYSYRPRSFATCTEPRPVTTNDEGTALALTSPTITSTSCCKLTCIHSDKSIHNLKSLAIATISIHITNWTQINKNTGLQNKPATRVDIFYFINECKRSLDKDTLPFIPVVIDDNIEYIKIIQIGSEYAGIGFRCDHVSDRLLNGFYGGCAGYESLPRDVFSLIMKFCTDLEVSRIHLDPDYILDHHRLLPANKQYKNLLDSIMLTPFISNLVIETEQDSDIELEEGDVLCLQSDWEDDES